MRARTSSAWAWFFMRWPPGRQAFQGSSTVAIFDAILHNAPTSPVRLNPEVPPKPEEIINKLLEKEVGAAVERWAQEIAGVAQGAVCS